jgi:hypothetical protein
MNAECIGRQLTPTEMAHVSALCRKRKVVEAISAHLFFALGSVEIKDAAAFLSDARYRDAINRAVFEVWKLFSPEYVPNAGFEALLRDVTAQGPLRIEMIDILYKEFIRPTAVSRLN